MVRVCISASVVSAIRVATSFSSSAAVSSPSSVLQLCCVRSCSHISAEYPLYVLSCGAPPYLRRSRDSPRSPHAALTSFAPSLHGASSRLYHPFAHGSIRASLGAVSPSALLRSMARCLCNQCRTSTLTTSLLLLFVRTLGFPLLRMFSLAIRSTRRSCSSSRCSCRSEDGFPCRASIGSRASFFFRVPYLLLVQRFAASPLFRHA